MKFCIIWYDRMWNQIYHNYASVVQSLTLAEMGRIAKWSIFLRTNNWNAILLSMKHKSSSCTNEVLLNQNFRGGGGGVLWKIKNEKKNILF